MTIKEYTKLPKEAIDLRTEIFIKEQGFIDEFDDKEDISTHLVMFSNNIPVASCRYYFDNEKNAYYIGRIVVVKDLRNKGLGKQILKEAEIRIAKQTIKTIYLSAQQDKADFYIKQGYEITGEPYFEEHCPHILTRKEL